MKKIIFLLAVICMITSIGCANYADNGTTTTMNTNSDTSSINEDTNSGHVLQLGAYVWYGFSYEGRHYTDRLLSEFAGREPEWGWTKRSQENMEYQIKLAKEYGLTFFAFDWYYGNENLNHAVIDFTRAKNRDEMKFCLLVANHDGARITYDNWKGACKTFVKFMSKDYSMRVDGKPLIIFYDIGNLVTDLGGEKKTKECFDYLRNELSQFGGAFIMGCECPLGTPDSGAIDSNYENFSSAKFKKRLERDENCGFDALTGYNYRRYSPIDGSYEIPFTTLTMLHEKNWDMMSKYGDIAYAPCIISGWDCRPYETATWNPNYTRSCYSPDRNADDFCDHILNAYKWLQDNPDQNKGNIGLVYAWDEVTEGGFLIPTKGEGYEMLNGLKKAMDIIDGEAK